MKPLPGRDASYTYETYAALSVEPPLRKVSIAATAAEQTKKPRSLYHGDVLIFFINEVPAAQNNSRADEPRRAADGGDSGMHSPSLRARS